MVHNGSSAEPAVSCLHAILSLRPVLQWQDNRSGTSGEKHTASPQRETLRWRHSLDRACAAGLDTYINTHTHTHTFCLAYQGPDSSATCYACCRHCDEVTIGGEASTCGHTVQTVCAVCVCLCQRVWLKMCNLSTREELLSPMFDPENTSSPNSTHTQSTHRDIQLMRCFLKGSSSSGGGTSLLAATYDPPSPTIHTRSQAPGNRPAPSLASFIQKLDFLSSNLSLLHLSTQLDASLSQILIPPSLPGSFSSSALLLLIFVWSPLFSLLLFLVPPLSPHTVSRFYLPPFLNVLGLPLALSLSPPPFSAVFTAFLSACSLLLSDLSTSVFS